MRFDNQPLLSDAAASLDSSPPALRRGASGDYSLLVGQALRAFASRSYVWLRCQTRTKLRPVHFESHCRLRSYEVLKRFLPYSFAATFQKVTQVARSAQLRTKIHYVSVSSVVTTTSLSTPPLVHGDVCRFHSVTSAAV